MEASLYLLLLGIVVALSGVLFCIISRHRRAKKVHLHLHPTAPCPLLLPGCWLVVKRRDIMGLHSALSLHNARLCTWMEGLTAADGLFIAPPIAGWILIVGGCLPNPWKDIDACFRFVLELSRKMGKVQLFSANQESLGHAWVNARAGRVVRAYAWAGQTIWNQGPPTKAEKELHLTCFDYCQPLPEDQVSALKTNLKRIPLLAAKWGLDPARIRRHLLLKERGVAGEPACNY